MKTTTHNFMAFWNKWERGHFNSLEKITHPDYIAKKDAQQRELRAALGADGIKPGNVEAVIAWAERKARAWEEGAKRGENPYPVERGYALNLVFMLRLLRGEEQFDG